jgi:hypothetical protein
MLTTTRQILLAAVSQTLARVSAMLLLRRWRSNSARLRARRHPRSPAGIFARSGELAHLSGSMSPDHALQTACDAER